MQSRGESNERGWLTDAWLGLAAAAPLTLLATYHRPYDATLLLLAIPACAALWMRGGWTGRIALCMTGAGAALTGSLAVAALFALASGLPLDPAKWSGRMGIVLLTRAPSPVLLAMAVFYLWVYAKRAREGREQSNVRRDTLVAYDSRRQEPEVAL